MYLSIPSWKFGATLKRIVALAALSFTISACASDMGSSTYGRHEVGRASYVDFGTVLDVRPVRITSDEPGAGTLAGAVIGGAVGSQIGEGDAARVVGVVGGALLGGAVGSAIEEDVNSRDGYEYTIRMENGDVMTVVQEADGPPIRSGTRVRILDGDRIRIVPDYDY
jgi:outer membrane lipoprotein SlyB